MIHSEHVAGASKPVWIAALEIIEHITLNTKQTSDNCSFQDMFFICLICILMYLKLYNGLSIMTATEKIKAIRFFNTLMKLQMKFKKRLVCCYH